MLNRMSEINIHWKAKFRQKIVKDARKPGKYPAWLIKAGTTFMMPRKNQAFHSSGLANTTQYPNKRQNAGKSRTSTMLVSQPVSVGAPLRRGISPSRAGP